MAVAAGLVIIDSLFGLPGCEAKERLSFVRVIRVVSWIVLLRAKTN
jgi:hypothetical protein